MKYKIVLGDYSNDGHGRVETFIVEVPDEFSPAQMKQSYMYAIEKTGINPAGICEDYEDYVVPDYVAEVLVEFGCDGIVPTPDDSYSVRDYCWDEDDATSSYVKMLMWYCGYNIPGFIWSFVSPDAMPSLFGGWGTSQIADDMFGYGLFF